MAIADIKDEKSRLVKRSGQVFTPLHIVTCMLDYCGYVGDNVLRRHIIDNSCGDGAFLCEAVERYCRCYLARKNSVEGLRAELEQYVHGIEIDEKAWSNCLFNLDNVAAGFGVKGVRWDVINADTLTVTHFDGLMDYVVGNPPYVRVHNLAENYTAVKAFYFANGGMTDLYLVFFEIGLRMLSPRGRLCYITPSSWLSSLAATNMRRYLSGHANLIGIIDLEHYQPFAATTYTLIALMDRQGSHSHVDYCVYDETAHDKRHVDSIALKDMCIGDAFYIADSGSLASLNDILTSHSKPYVKVKNGFAPLSDKVFISDELPFSEFTIPVIKASTGKWSRCFFPYDKAGKPLPKEQIFGVKAVAQYLEAHKRALLKGKTEAESPCWYLYGRTQALKDVNVSKLAISTIIKDKQSIKLNIAGAGTGVYSGLYVVSDTPVDEIRQLIISDDFVNYVMTLKEYKSGGYYTFNSRALETYLNYRITEKHDRVEHRDKKQRSFSESYINFV